MQAFSQAPGPRDEVFVLRCARVSRNGGSDLMSGTVPRRAVPDPDVTREPFERPNVCFRLVPYFAKYSEFDSKIF
eukprot:4598817-Prymnesium_polylepis.1